MRRSLGILLLPTTSVIHKLFKHSSRLLIISLSFTAFLKNFSPYFLNSFSEVAWNFSMSSHLNFRIFDILRNFFISSLFSLIISFSISSISLTFFFKISEHVLLFFFLLFLFFVSFPKLRGRLCYVVFPCKVEYFPS